MIFPVTVVRLTFMTGMFAGVLALTDSSFATDDLQKTRYTPARQSIAIVSNGIVTSSILNGPNGLEVSSNAPGMITIASGSQALNLHGDYVTLSGDVAFAPGATPGVTITVNRQGGYTVVLDIPTESDLGQ